MPRETIRSPKADSDFCVQVGWSREAEYVQIGTGQDTHSVEVGTRAWFADLDRASVNKLIVTLRRARDQAFGRDE